MAVSHPRYIEPKQKKTYLIAYELNAPGQDYAALEERLRTLKATRILETVWLYDATMPDQAKAVFDDLKRHALRAGNSLLVAELGSTQFHDNIPSPRARGHTTGPVHAG
jgi:hypothetical protein